jgi:predicted Fe-S protein YdhL (DUF1289 family)
MSDKNAFAIPSPCVGFCQLDEASGLCVGCARSAAEIAAWKSAPPAVLEHVWSELPGRRERLGISPAIQGRIFVVNAAALVALVALHWAGVAVGIASRSRFPFPVANRAV